MIEGSRPRDAPKALAQYATQLCSQLTRKAVLDAIQRGLQEQSMPFGSTDCWRRVAYAWIVSSSSDWLGQSVWHVAAAESPSEELAVGMLTALVLHAMLARCYQRMYVIKAVHARSLTTWRGLQLPAA